MILSYKYNNDTNLQFPLLSERVFGLLLPSSLNGSEQRRVQTFPTSDDPLVWSQCSTKAKVERTTVRIGHNAVRF